MDRLGVIRFFIIIAGCMQFDVGASGDRGDCTFDADLCGWTQSQADGGWNWRQQSGGTTTGGTGPSDDVTGGGMYMYFETSAIGSNKRAILESPMFEPTITDCMTLTFYYHMYGTHIGTLNVNLTSAVSNTLLWSLSGDQGNQWVRSHEIELQSDSDFYVLFEAVHETGWKGDIAIDQVNFTRANCVPGTTLTMMTSSTFSLTSSSSSSETVTMETTTPFVASSTTSPVTEPPITTPLQTLSSATGPVTTAPTQTVSNDVTTGTSPAMTTPSVDTHTTPKDDNTTTVPTTISYSTSANAVDESTTDKAGADVTSMTVVSTTDKILPTDSAELTTISDNSSSVDEGGSNVTMTTPMGNATNHVDVMTSENPINATTNHILLTTSPENTEQNDNQQTTGPPLVPIILGVTGGILIVGVSVTLWVCKRRNGKDIFKDLIPLVDKKPENDSSFEDFPYYGEVLSAREAEPVFGQLQVGGQDAV